MAYTLEKKINNKKRYYLVENLRTGKNKWKKFTVYLASGTLSKEQLKKLAEKKKPVLEEKVDDYKRSVDTLYSLLSVDELKELKQIVKQYHRAVKDEVYYPSFEEEFITSFTYDSNAIEGSSLTLGEVSLLLYDKITPKGKSLREVHEAENHKDAFTYLESFKGDVTLQLILEVHRILMHNILFEHAGKFRDVQVIVHGAPSMPPPFHKVIKMLGELLAWYDHNKKKYNPLIVAAYFHTAFEGIHPFRDGNGRAGRLLLNFMLLKNKYPLVNIQVKQRQEYMHAIREGINGNLKPMVDLLITCIKNNKIVQLPEQKKLEKENNPASLKDKP